MTEDPTPLRARLRGALTPAMKARDAAAVAALRSALAAIDNAEAVSVTEAPPTTTEGPIAKAAVGLGAGEGVRRDLDEAQMVAIVAAEVAERRAVAVEYDRSGAAERAARLRAEADVLAAHLGSADSR